MGKSWEGVKPSHDYFFGSDMKYQYGTRAVERVWERNSTYVTNNIVKRLMRTMGVGPREYTYEDLIREVQFLFFAKFYDYYETPSQYLSFLFICAKNLIRNRKVKNRILDKYFVTDPADIANAVGLVVEDEHVNTVWDQVSDKKDIFNKITIPDLVEQIYVRLQLHTRQVFEMMIKEFSEKEICERLGITIGKLTAAKREIRNIARNLLRESYA